MTDRAAWSPVLHLISPASATSWFPHFALLTADDLVRELGEGPYVDLKSVRRDLTEGRAGDVRHVVVFSSHDALQRDLRLAYALRAEGVSVSAQSPTCARLGYDKFAMKEFFDAHNLDGAHWGRAAMAASIASSQTSVVVKHRHGTQSVGTRLSTVERCALAPDEFAEVFIDGVEYSVVVFRDEHGTATFPPVWKGRTATDLTPPWRRLRLCPAPDTSPAQDARLREAAARVVNTAGGMGHVEVEMVVDDDGGCHVLEQLRAKLGAQWDGAPLPVGDRR